MFPTTENEPENGSPQNQPWVVCGTDTDVGKTVVSAILVRQAIRDGESPSYIKPVQTGPDSDTQTVLQLAEPESAPPPILSLPLPASVDQAAKDAKAVNTLMNHPCGEVMGFNTDGVGLVNDLLNNNTELADKRILLIGAGGAARGVISPLLGAGVQSLTLANRTLARAEQVAAEAGQGKIDVVELTNAAAVKPHIIINSTAASLNNTLPLELSSNLVEECELVYDMVYKKQPTLFMQEAEGLGVAKTLDGLGMLVEQAAAAFSIWTGKRPETKKVIVKLREIIAKQ